MASSGDQRPKTCFVVMPITTPDLYTEQTGDPDHFSHVLSDLFVPALENLGYQVLLPSVTGSELIQAEIIKNLEQADLVLCDLSSLNPNVFFELGIRTALDRPVALVRDRVTLQIPFDLAAINVLTYDGSLKSWTVKDEISRLTTHIKASAKSPPGRGNPMWRYFRLTQRATPAEIEDPTDAKFSLILSEIAELKQSRTTGVFYSSSLEPEIPQSVLDTLRQVAYTEGIMFGMRTRREATSDQIGELIAQNPRVPRSIDSALMQESKMSPDLLRDPDIRGELRRGFWDGFERTEKINNA